MRLFTLHTSPRLYLLIPGENGFERIPEKHANKMILSVRKQRSFLELFDFLHLPRKLLGYLSSKDHITPSKTKLLIIFLGEKGKRELLNFCRRIPVMKRPH